ncbi:MAG: alanine:cation symporter family protein, partial [Agathobacter sp.]|nr:alanine:cation symporter family protein [Agathobacter sp.]
PGALFWMWIAALFGTATKYAECLLAIKYRVVAKDGHVVGGPFYYIENGMGKNWKWLANMFAVFGVGAGLLGIGTFTQINGITGAVKNFFDPNSVNTVVLFGYEYSWAVVISGLVITLCTALVLIGGVKRISKVAEFVVPFMAICYISSAVIILVTHASEIPGALREVIECAFGLRAAAGGALGSIMVAMQKGIARGIFSNEAGLGSAPIAAATVKTDEPVEQGLVSMTGTVIDTLIICTMTGLSILVTNTWNIGLEGVDVTIAAFQAGLPFSANVSSFILMMCLVFFAFTTILGWDYYSEKCMEYIVGDKPKVIKAYRWIYILAVFIGPYMTVSAVWTIADIFNGLMAFPNLIALFALSGVVAAETKKYFEKHK